MVDYIVLMATLLVLFFGLLFFINQFPYPWMQIFAVTLATLIVVRVSVIVALMIIFDIITRKKKEAKLRKERRRQLLLEYGAMKETELRQLYRKQFPSIWTRMNVETHTQEDDDDAWVIIENELAKSINEYQWNEEQWIVTPNVLVEDPVVEKEFADMDKSEEVAFALPFYISDDERSDEDMEHSQSLQELTENLFGANRTKKKLQFLKKKFKKLIK